MITATATRAVISGLTAAAAAVPVALLTAAPASAATISADTARTLQYMVAEEKLARDVYTVLGEQYGVRVFDSIARAESRHMSSVRMLLARYGVSDPTAGDPAGHFDDPRLQALYDSLTEQGRQSLMAAADAGRTIERTDIADLDAALATTDAADISRVLQSLRRGSLNHLAAFSRLASSRTTPGPGRG